MHYHYNGFVEDIYFAKTILYNNMDQTKLAQQLFNLSEETYRLLYHIVFSQVCSACGIIPDGFAMNKNPCIGKPSKKLMSVGKVSYLMLTQSCAI